MHPILSRWKPDFRQDWHIQTAFTFNSHIRQPIHVLHSLGIDVFKDSRFDTWVVMHLINRMSVNYITYQRPATTTPESPPDGSQSNSGEAEPKTTSQPPTGTVYSLGS